MSKYTVHFTTEASLSITVEADDPDEAIGKADDEICSPGALVYASHPRGFDMGGEWEPECVTDSTGKEVWTYRAAKVVESLGLTREHRTLEDGYGGQVWDVHGNPVPVQSRPCTRESRYVTRWERDA